jgi:S1-C subfamily serine protease
MDHYFMKKNNLDNIILPALRRGIAGEAHNKLLSDINNFSNYFDRVSNLVEWKSDMYLRGSWLLDGNEYLEISGDFNLRMSKPPEGEISFGGTATLLIDPYSGNLRASHQNIKFTTQEDNGPVSGQGIYFVEYHLPQSLPSSLSIGVGVAKPQKSGHKTASEIYKTAISSVVEVKSGASVGSGFAIKPDLIVTNSHVLVDGEDVRVVTSSGRELKALRIIDNDAAEIDLAFLRTNESVTNTPLKLSPELPNVGIQALVIGSPGGLAGTLTGGLVSQVRFFKGVRLIQIDASVNRGNSGGPVLNANGEVIGVATKGLKSEKGWVGLNFAISAIEVIEKSPKFLGVNTHK